MKSPRPLLLFLAASALFAQSRIAEIEFFGSKGVDVEAVRKALPVKAGDSLGPETDRQIRETVQRVTGKDATDIAHVCCDKQGGSFVYIGLAGQSSRAFALNAEPTGKTQVSPELATLSRKMDEALFAAVRSGNAAEQQPSPGYRLPKEPKAREATLAFRQYALQHEDDLYRVLESSSDGKQRAIAADALGFTSQSARQIAALIHASRDPNDEVRNNATRALLEISQAGPTAASQIPPDTFIDMLWSGVWSDRNKSSALLMMLTASRDPKLLARLRTEALDPLTEIAGWDPDHAMPARMILGILPSAAASKP
ncbi:MAG TPA: hypothetical protein VFW44_08110 [Bryobacteraceae bacterium]|nr:hypothetical protein [Bryobacteraceae bacterium]